MKLIVKKNKAVYLGLFILNLIIAFLAYFILPNKFFNDTKIIVYDLGNEIGYLGSYPLSILFYKVTLLRYLPFPLIALIQYPILIYILYRIGVPDKFHILTVKNILIYLGFFMLAIFVSMPSKEFITFLYISMVPFIFMNSKYSENKKIFLVLFLIALFGAFRVYYALIPIIAVGIYLVSFLNFKNKVYASIFYGVLISVFLSLSVGVLTGKFISESTREELNTERRFSKEANSMIVSPVQTDTWYGETISIFNGFVAVNIPVFQGIKHFLSPQIVAFVVWQLFLLYILLVRFSRCLRDREKFKLELWTIIILFSYYIVQGMFEPDLGTATRHKIGFFPLLYFIFYYEDFRRKV
jgi:hypothetical protein